MIAEFVDTSILLYAHEAGAGRKHEKSVELLTRLVAEGTGAVSTQILAEFYFAATKKLGIASVMAEDVVRDLGVWTIHRPDHADLLHAAQLQRRYRMGWRDAQALESALALKCRVFWTEDFENGRRYERVTARNPFK